VNSIIPASNYIIRKFIIDHTNNRNYPIRIGGNGVTTCTNVLIEDVVLRNTQLSDGGAGGATGLITDDACNFITFRRMHIHHNGEVPGGGPGGYFQSDDTTFEDGWVHHNSYIGIQCYGSFPGVARPDRCKILRSIIENNDNAGIFLEGDDDEAIGNIIRNNGGGIDTGSNGAARAHIYNNVIANGSINIGASGSGPNSIIRNNIMMGNVTVSAGSTGTIVSHNACLSSSNCGTNKLTIASIADLTVSSSNFSLKPGSAAINAGIDVGLPFNGSAPDIGMSETFLVSSATVATNVVEVVVGMNLNTPVVPTSSGWSVGCTGTGCGSPVVSTVTLKSGTSATIQLVITGITGTNCDAGQTWTVSYSSATGTTTNFTWVVNRQALTSATNFAVTNNCTGGGPPPPAGLHIYYKLDDGTGTNANDETANNLDGTLTNSPAWVAARNGQGVSITQASTQYIAMPYGSGINPLSQSLTVSFWVYVTDVNFLGIRWGAPLGTNQRLYIGQQSGTWRIGVQDSNYSTGASDKAVEVGWTHLCMTVDNATPGSGTGTATLHVNGVASNSPNAKKTYTSYALADNFRVGGIAANPTPGGIYDDVKLWLGIVSCADDFASSNPPTSPWIGTLSSVAAQFYMTKTDPASVLIPLGKNNANVTIPPGGAWALLLETKCEAGVNCTPIGQKLFYSCAACPSNGSILLMPNTATTDGIEFWGQTTEPGLLSGAPPNKLTTGTSVDVAGGTNPNADTIPVVGLNQNQSTVIAYLGRIVPGTPTGRTFCMKPREQSGLDLNGGYTPPGGACVTVGIPTSTGGP
jgi:hypothetical protein